MDWRDHLAEIEEHHDELIGRAGSAGLPKAMTGAVMLLKKGYTEIEGVADLCRRAECGETTLLSQFRTYAGMKPKTYLDRECVRRAVEVMKERPFVTLPKVAEAVGCCSARTLRERFVRELGVTPKVVQAGLRNVPETRSREPGLD